MFNFKKKLLNSLYHPDSFNSKTKTEEEKKTFDGQNGKKKKVPELKADERCGLKKHLILFFVTTAK